MQIMLKRAAIIACLLLFLIQCNHQSMKKNSIAGISTDSAKIPGLLVYIGTYTEKEAHVDGKASGIYIYELDMATGRLKYIAASPATINPSFLTIHPGGKWLYAVNETGSSKENSGGNISAFRLTNNGRALEFINTVPSEGNYPCYIAVDKTGKYIMAANYGSGTVALLPVMEDGSLKNAVDVDQHIGNGVTSNQKSAHAHMIITSVDNRFAYSCDLGTDHIYKYLLDLEKGKLIPSGDSYKTQPGAGPRHLVLHPAKNLAYVINELNGTIECLKADSGTGTLTKFQTISTLSEGDGTAASCADIHITPTGQFLYASNRGNFNNIAMYSVDPISGTLTLIGHQSVKGNTPRNFVIDPTGNYLLVANQNSNNVVTFRIDQSTGRLVDIGVETAVPTPVCLRFLPQ